ncbi:transporter substrate-binding domain-containing protein [Magnetospira sp. QH-2]|uniref:transporter substrate-binding domain-containing protein n=1 Tax=Magnetospira sp. (strain QH-2) TaxID=1288970 RepID=UPI0003E81601|nr:transporter substrate-binding domain-containing protein [Magnetospira sp. QH-2]CCQ74185.1 exported protein of unknown function [Magnetospira sp. QH-2]
MFFKSHIIAIGVLIAALFIEPSIAIGSNSSISLTQTEQDWIKQNPTIKIANETDWPPFDYVRNGQPYGFSIDMIQKAAEIAGLNIEFVNGLTWPDLIKEFHAGNIDVLPAVYFTPERSETMLFTDGYAVNPAALVLHKDRTELNNLDDLRGLSLAAIADTSFDHLIKERYPNITRTHVDGALDGMTAVSFGNADGFIESLSVVTVLLEENLLSNLKVVAATGLHRDDENTLRMAVKKIDEPLRDILQKSLKAIDDGARNKLFQTHFASNGALYEIRNTGQTKINFSEKEKQWLRAHPVVTYSEVNWKPMSIIENGTMTGVMGDYLSIISEETGIRFDFVAADSWPDVLKKFGEQKLDIVPGVGNSANERALGLISDAYSRYPLVIVGRNNANFVNGPEDLEGMTLAIPKFYTSYNYIKENFPELNVRATTSIEKALSLVSSGEADVFIGHKLVSIYNMEALYLRNLKIIGITEFEFRHSILVQNSDPELLSILNKVIARIDVKTKKKIYDDWVKISIEQAVDYIFLSKIGAGILAFLLVMVYWNRKLGREIAERKKVEAALGSGPIKGIPNSRWT